MSYPSKTRISWPDSAAYGAAAGEPQDVTTDLEDPASEPGPEQECSGPTLTAAYVGVLLFCAVYFIRPGEFVAALKFVPFAKITGILAGGALLAALLSGTVRLKTEARLLIALFGYLCLSIPFSTWRGGSFLVVLGFGKIVIIAIATASAVTTVGRLRRLMLLQTLAMLAMCVAALGAARHNDNGFGRMYGVGSLFADPNDFALNLCIVLSFCVSLLLTCRRWLGKAFWIAAIALILCSIVSTYSRGGFLALIVVTLAMWRRFRVSALGAVPILLLAALSILLAGHSAYLDRMRTITDPQEEASAQARQEVLRRSLELSLKHPLFGVGPDQFAQVSGRWQVPHNSYAQLSAEAGLPSLALFLAMIWLTFRNLRQASRVSSDAQRWYLVQGLYCGMAGYVAGAFFLTTAYLVYPYLLMAYASAAAQITDNGSMAGTATEGVPGPGSAARLLSGHAGRSTG